MVYCESGDQVIRRIFAVTVVTVCMLLTAGCNTNVLVSGSLPTPLVKKLPLNMGVYYPPEFRDFTHQEKIYEQGTWTVDMGTQNLEFFRGMFAAMFDQIVEIQEMDIPSSDEVGTGNVFVPENLDGIIVPEIVKYGFLTPQISGLSFFPHQFITVSVYMIRLEILLLTGWLLVTAKARHRCLVIARPWVMQQYLPSGMVVPELQLGPSSTRL